MLNFASKLFTIAPIIFFFEQTKIEYIRNTKGSSCTRCAQESSKVLSYRVPKM